MPKKSPIYATGIAVEPEALGLTADYQISLSVSRDDDEELSADELKKIKAALARVVISQDDGKKPAKKKPQAAE